ncbi:hypothetical protein [Iodobacter fluviatilis]|uniref:Uncharacterized protein n=1 Tax=Iodobacter fluviatilis TaxID=537 RepID=A0A7G3GG02_9NEIS|nr:hypothetical protein [Iodobacter fluviatilis]QBC45855.1 hypothetical protein C1H71_20140 [Iodobacter fluviatilis]
MSSSKMLGIENAGRVSVLAEKNGDLTTAEAIKVTMRADYAALSPDDKPKTHQQWVGLGAEVNKAFPPAADQLKALNAGDLKVRDLLNKDKVNEVVKPIEASR